MRNLPGADGPDAGPPDAPTPDDVGGDEGSGVDRRLVQVLSGSSSGADLRRSLQNEGTEEAADLLGRLNALEFVDGVVGSPVDVPKRLGEYEIRGVLGRGGMGTVYLGFQPQLEREVALKMLAPQYSADPTMRQRFRAEAKATAALHHRHIVPIYDYGEAQGLLYFAMERVDGQSLDKHIAAARRHGRPPMQPIEAARRFAGVADALGFAHRRRLLHRDVKPGNILVGSDGTLALTDFGLAKALDQQSRLTSKAGGFLGTIHYASPEQLTGRELGPASDLYSLGVTMFEAVTGELPVQAKTTEALFHAIVHGQRKRLRHCLKRPPRDLEAVLDNLLSLEPGDRYQDGEMLARDLQRIADGEPVQIRRQPLLLRVWRLARKNPVLSGALAAAVVLLLLTAGLLSVLRREQGQGRLSRHQNNLARIAVDVKNELGPPFGPAPLLQSLCGISVPGGEPSPAILAALQRADAELPGDPQVAAMRSAYSEDPLPEASLLLGEGRGFEALQLFDQAIVRLGGDLAGAGHDHAAELRLYRLYLGRAVANLTQSVARLPAASRDLALASFLRRGAAFPLALQAALEVVQHQDVPTALDRLERELAAASPERRKVVAMLLWTAAGIRPASQANLMPFPLSFANRRALHELATRWLGAEPATTVPLGAPTGLAARFAQSAGEAIAHVGEPAVLHDLAAGLRAVIDRSVHPESPLQGWRAVLQLLEQPLSLSAIVDRDDEPLDPALQLAAWDDLLQLRPARPLLDLLLPKFEELRRNHPGLPGMARVAALLHDRARSGEALRHAMAWVVEETADPQALMCRMRCRLRGGELDAALDDGMAAVQRDADRIATAELVAKTWEEMANEAGAGVREALLAMAQTFRAAGDGVVR